jgi:hypothetical protein
MSVLRLIAGIKLNRIEMYGNTSSTPSTVTVEWLSNYGPSSEISDTSTSTASPAHLVSSPPPQSLASFWSMIGINESESLFNVTAGTGTILDIWCDIVLLDGQGNTVATTSSASGTYFYVSYLDGPGAASPIWSPTSVISIN